MVITEQKYKPSELGPIPEDWIEATFGEVLKGFSSGMTPYRAKPEYYKGDILWITSGELNYNVITDTEEKISPKAVIDTNLKLLPPGTFLMAITGLEAAGTRGSCAIVGAEATTNQSCMALFGTNKMSTDYLFHFYVNYGEMFAFKYCQGSKQQSYTGRIAKLLPVILPPTLEEQKAIAAALSDTDALIAGLEKLIAKKKAIKQGAMQQLLTPPHKGGKRLPEFSGEWEEKKLGDVADVIMGQSPLSKFYNSEKVGLPLIQGNADVKNRKTIIRNYTSQVTKRGNDRDIIMSVRAPVGEIARAQFDCCLGRGVCAVRFKNDFLYHYLINLEESWSKFSTGSTFDSITSKQVRELEIYLPNESTEQTVIALILNDMDKEIEALESKKVKFEGVKQGMMQELLTGKTRLV